MNSDSKSKEISMGSKSLAEDIMQRLELLGIKRNEKFKTMYDAVINGNDNQLIELVEQGVNKI